MIKRVFYRLSANKPTAASVKDTKVGTDNLSSYEKSSCYSKVQHFEGIWRAPRELGYSKETFYRFYPDGYKNMRIGLPEPGTRGYKYLNSKLDEVAPLLWLAFLSIPLIYKAIKGPNIVPGKKHKS